jgi:hypothetical protein
VRLDPAEIGRKRRLLLTGQRSAREYDELMGEYGGADRIDQIGRQRPRKIEPPASDAPSRR